MSLTVGGVGCNHTLASLTFEITQSPLVNWLTLLERQTSDGPRRRHLTRLDAFHRCAVFRMLAPSRDIHSHIVFVLHRPGKVPFFVFMDDVDQRQAGPLTGGEISDIQGAVSAHWLRPDSICTVRWVKSPVRRLWL